MCFPELQPFSQALFSAWESFHVFPHGELQALRALSQANSKGTQYETLLNNGAQPGACSMQAATNFQFVKNAISGQY